MMIFGGFDDDKNQISVVEGCQLRRIGDLPIDFTYGACNTFTTTAGNEETLLCFSWSSGWNKCHR